MTALVGAGLAVLVATGPTGRPSDDVELDVAAPPAALVAERIDATAPPLSPYLDAPPPTTTTINVPPVSLTVAPPPTTMVDPQPTVPTTIEAPSPPADEPDEPPSVVDEPTVGGGFEDLRQCESGGDYDAVSPGGAYTGAYQFDRQTWASVGGSGRAGDAPAWEQDMRAQMLYEERGSSPWPHCGRYL